MTALTDLANGLRSQATPKTSGATVNAPQSAQPVVQGTAPPTPPVFVPTQVIDPRYTALQKALQTIGSLGQTEAKVVKQIFGAQAQLLNQAG